MFCPSKRWLQCHCRVGHQAQARRTGDRLRFAMLGVSNIYFNSSIISQVWLVHFLKSIYLEEADLNPNSRTGRLSLVLTLVKISIKAPLWMNSDRLDGQKYNLWASHLRMLKCYLFLPMIVLLSVCILWNRICFFVVVPFFNMIVLLLMLAFEFKRLGCHLSTFTDKKILIFILLCFMQFSKL